jgi:hypothetical protein
MIALAERCAELQDLDVTGLDQITDRGILEVVQGCPRFKRLIMDDGQGQGYSVTAEILETSISCHGTGTVVVQRKQMLETRAN